MIKKSVWDKKHKDSDGKYNKVTEFAKLCYFNFLKGKKGRLLELGCGKGADAMFFHRENLKVRAIDYSKEAIRQFNELQQTYNTFIPTLVKDITEELPFEEDYFKFAYSRATLYYFTHNELKNIIKEVSRVLESEGLFMFQVKSTSDKKYGKGKKLEEDMFEEKEDYVRHYFSKEYAAQLLEENFHIIMNEERVLDNGSAYLEVIAEKR